MSIAKEGEMSDITQKDRQLAQKCIDCPVCLRARDKQKGLAYHTVKTLAGCCPYCRAYEKVYGRKPYAAYPKVDEDSHS
jgi:hypothetical protein